MASYGLDTEVLPVLLPARCHERHLGRHRRSNRGKPLEGAGNSGRSGTRGPAWLGAPTSAVWPRAPSGRQSGQPGNTQRSEPQKPALQPKDQEVGRLPEINSVCIRNSSSLAQTAQKSVAPAPSPPAEVACTTRAEDKAASPPLRSGWSRLSRGRGSHPRLTAMNTPAWGQRPACCGQASEIRVL